MGERCSGDGLAPAGPRPTRNVPWDLPSSCCFGSPAKRPPGKVSRTQHSLRDRNAWLWVCLPLPLEGLDPIVVNRSSVGLALFPSREIIATRGPHMHTAGVETGREGDARRPRRAILVRTTPHVRALPVVRGKEYFPGLSYGGRGLSMRLGSHKAGAPWEGGDIKLAGSEVSPAWQAGSRSLHRNCLQIPNQQCRTSWQCADSKAL